MPENKFQKIWKDPVWSKVISVIIVAIGTIIYNVVISKLQNVEFVSVFIAFWNSQIKLWIAVTAFILYVIVSSLWTYVNRKKMPSFEYDDKTLGLDIALFNRIRNELLPQAGTIYWLRHNNFAGFSFDMEKLEPLDDIEYKSKNQILNF